MDLGLAGKKALVTGASRGIGRAIAELLAAEGASVAICARSDEGVKEAVAAIEAAGAAKAWGAVADVANGDNYKGWVKDAGEALGGIDIFVHNVSALSTKGEEGWKQSFETDVMGLVRGVEVATPALVESGTGSIVALSTTAAFEFFGGPSAYGVVKAGIINYINALSQSLGSKGVRANVVSPGPVYFDGGSWEKIKTGMPAFYEGTIKQIPMGRMSDQHDVARAVVFLASPAAAMITGTNLVVDGGITKRVQL